MRLDLCNINKIKNASIDFCGLTVIAGENDSGKSTVGKLLFSIIKAIARQNEDLEQSKESRIQDKTDAIYFKIGSRHSVKELIELEELKRLFFPPRLVRELKIFIDNQIESFMFEDEIENFDNIFKDRILAVDNIADSTLKEFIMLNIKDIKNICLEQPNPQKAFKDSFEKAYFSEFNTSIICNYSKSEASILLDYLSGSILIKESSLHGKSGKNVKIDGEYLKPFDDATFIETPLFIQLTDSISNSSALFTDKKENKLRRFAKVQLHVKDLMNKLPHSRYKTLPENNYLVEKISNIINGHYYYDNDNNEYLFEQNINKKKQSLPNSSVASGIKTFGVIQMLLESGEINRRKVLIIDEPENHLHPKWQIAFAEIIVELSKSGIPVLISSHSPYFIQGIKYYSSKLNFDDVAYYLADSDNENPNMSIIKDVTNDLNQVFVKLSEPLNQILDL